MNFNDSEVVASVLEQHNIKRVNDMNQSDILLVNTCSIRDNAEQRVWGRLDIFRQVKKKNPKVIVGVIGCMAERLKEKLLEEYTVDMVIGPDAYRELPYLLNMAESGQKAINVLLSKEETYDNIMPVRMDKNGVSAFVSIMRGCNNMCSYCVVPYTRGRERSRDPETILNEVRELIDKGYKEVTLLGQNVNSYTWDNDQTGFPKLLEKVASLNDHLRVRYSTSHPKDMSDDVLKVMAAHNNICKNIHLPVQSGSTTVLKRMKRGYTRESYLNRVESIKKIMPDCGISTDIIAGFCGETDAEHQDTISLMKLVGYDFAFMFKYSERPDTYAAKKMKDDVPEETKTNRLNQIIALQNELSLQSHKKDIGKTFEVLTEGISKKSDEHFFGRNSQNKVVVFPKQNNKIGDYVKTTIINCTSATLLAE